MPRDRLMLFRRMAAIRNAFVPASILVLLAFEDVAFAEVEPVVHYHLRLGEGGIRDTAAPAVLKSLVSGGPDLEANGSPKVMSNAPAIRREAYDSSIQFDGGQQCYRTAKNLVRGDRFVVEAWAYALKDRDDGWHGVVVNGNGGSGFILGQSGDQWSLLIGGVGSFSLGKIEANRWTHLALVQSGGALSAWIDGKKVGNRWPCVGGGIANFSIGAAAPGKEAFTGWIAEVRHSTFKPGKFDPATDFLLDSAKIKLANAAAIADRVKLVESLTAVPGVQTVAAFDERPAQDDWLVKAPATPSSIQVLAAKDKSSAQIMLSNGLVSRTFLVTDNLGCISLRRSDKDAEFLRAVKPEVRFRVSGSGWIEVGGLVGALDRSFLAPEWLADMETKPAAFRFVGMTAGGTVKPYEWRPKCNAPAISWPAKGQRITFHFAPPPQTTGSLKDLTVDVHYEIYDGLPTIMKTFTLHNKSGKEIVVNEINGEYLAVLQDKKELLHVESDYSFATANLTSESSALGIHVPGGQEGPWKNYILGGGTTRWENDPDWGSMATLNPADDVFLNNPQRTLLVSKPPVGPGVTVPAGEAFQAFRTYEILNDSTEKERRFLAQRRFYRKLAPQTNEHQMEVHCPTHNVAVLKVCMDQMSELGFERLQIEHPVGIGYANLSDGNIKWLKELCDYGKSKKVRLGGYELMMASQGRGAENDCIDPATNRPGSIFGQSGCACSKWGEEYAVNMFRLIDATGLGSFDPDGPYHGDPCASTKHPGHRGLEDSQWQQWTAMCKILHECQRRGLYVTVPDWYFLNGQVCTGMGYREATDNIEIVLQTVLYRQYIFDGTYDKTPGMGWVNLNTEVLRGGLEANLDRYERQLFGMVSSGAQVWVRGAKLYDGPKSRAMVEKWMTWYRKYRDIIQGDIIHLHRPDGRSLDYILHVNPEGKEKGMLLVFNPTDVAVTKTLEVPLKYAGLTTSATIREQEGEPHEYALSRDAVVRLPVAVPANGYTWFICE